MINSANTRFYKYIFLLAVFCLSVSAALGQEKSENKNQAREFCTNNNDSYNGKRAFKELRESTVARGNLLTVDGQQNGGIRVKGSDRSDILVRACIQTWDDSDATAQSRAKNIRIETSPIVRAVGLDGESHMSVSYEILVPRNTNLKLTTQNGGIGITGVEGSMDFSAMNGGISLNEVAGDVRGRTTNGGVNVNLSGNSWKGRGLDLQTTNGGVRLSLPQNFAAHLEASTVNGGFRSDLDLSVKLKDMRRGVNVNSDINGGGAPIRVVTTNGGVVINAANANRQM